MNQKYLFIAGMILGCLPFWGMSRSNGEEKRFDPLDAPPVLKPVPEKYADSARMWQGISSLEVTSNDRLWACWYSGGTTEDGENYVLLATSPDRGTTWSKPILAIDPPGMVRAFDPSIWMDPKGRLWLFWAQGEENPLGPISVWDGRGGVWAIRTDHPELGEEAQWTEPRRISDGVMMGKPIADSRNRWLLPVALWRVDGFYTMIEEERGVAVWCSEDEGETFRFLGRSIGSRYISAFDEQNIVEMKDGSLKMFARLQPGYGIGETVSADGGKTWTDLAPSPIQQTSSRFYIRRLKSGSLLMVKNGPADCDVGRSMMTAMISDDEGKTWHGNLLLDERSGVTYPDGNQAEDGTIYVTYDFDRYNAREIYAARFTEADVRAGTLQNPASARKLLINKATGPIPPKPDALTPSRVLRPIPRCYEDDMRGFQGISSLEVTPDGNVWACWYSGGPDECSANYVLISVSTDRGETWSKPIFAVDPDGYGPIRTFDPSLWTDPNGVLHLFYAQSSGPHGHDGRWGVWEMTTSEPEKGEAAQWSDPVRLCDGIMINKPIVDSRNRWLYPVSVWRVPCMWKDQEPSNAELGEERNPDVFCSTDEGKTVSLLGHSHVPEEFTIFDEHHIVELKDGTYKMYVRTTYGIGEAVSADGGVTWSDVAPSPIPNPNSRFFIRRLASGNLLLVKNGPIDEPVDNSAGGVTGRNRVTAYLSEDDGKTFIGGLMLDERESTAYPDGGQLPDGTIFITNDHDRYNSRDLRCHRFTEEDVRAGRIVSNVGKLGLLINQAAGPVQKKAQMPVRFTPRPNDDGVCWPADVKRPELKVIRGGAFQTLSVGTRLFTNRGYAADFLPDCINDRPFLCAEIDGWEVEALSGGTVFVLSPMPDRNTDSLTAELTAAGFQKVQVPEFVMFDNSVTNIVTLWTKTVQKGEKIGWDKKWGILIL